jgi:nucleotide-binding universal stress UspA family protein
MFRRLLVPLDGSRLAEAVLPAVNRLCELISCSVQLLHVIEKRPPSTIHGDTHLRDARQAEVYLDSIADRLKSSGLDVETHVHTVPQGDIPKCIAEHAVELDQDLIVLCAHGAGGLRRFVFGSNAEQLLMHGDAPVMLIQADEHGVARQLGPGPIVVLLDNTPASEPALTTGAELAKAADAHLHLLAVVPTLTSMKAEQAATGRLIPQATRQVLDLASEEAAFYLRERIQQLADRAITATGRVERGDTASAAVSVARETRSDLMIIAARGLAGLSGFWADAVTRKVAGSFDGALLLIPRADVGEIR